MRVPVIRGIIDRRILVNFRVDPSVLAAVLPSPFHPQLVGGMGIAGICMIRLTKIRPTFLPAFVGISSENAAHRIAVEWEANRQQRTGVFIPRRDTSSRLNAFAGGRLFPGVHHHAEFEVEEQDDHFRVEMTSHDGLAHVSVEADIAAGLSTDSVFSSVDEASRFFESGSLGYSPVAAGDRFDGMELRTSNWRVEPLAVRSVVSSFFDDSRVFPAGSATFDNALLMRGIDHEWHDRESLCCAAKQPETVLT